MAPFKFGKKKESKDSKESKLFSGLRQASGASSTSQSSTLNHYQTTPPSVPAPAVHPHIVQDPTPWTRAKLPISPFPRYRHVSSAYVSETDEVYVIGGLHDQSVYGDTWILKGHMNYRNFTTKTIDITEHTPPPRVGHASTLCGNAFVVFGGDTHKVNADGMMDDDIYLFNINSYKWTIPQPVGKRPLGRYGHKVSVIAMKQMETKLYLFGGQFDDTYFNDLCVFDLSSFRRPDSHWEFMKPRSFAPPPLANHVMISYDYKLWVFGGETPHGLINDVFVYDPLVNDWTLVETSGNKPEPVQEHAAVLYRDLMVVVGGKDANGMYLNHIHFLNLKTRKWYKLPDELRGVPEGRSGHSVTLLKSNKLLIMGGDKFDYASLGEDNFAVSDEDQGLGTLVYILDLNHLDMLCPGVFEIPQGDMRSSVPQHQNVQNILTPKAPRSDTPKTDPQHAKNPLPMSPDLSNGETKPHSPLPKLENTDEPRVVSMSGISLDRMSTATSHIRESDFLDNYNESVDNLKLRSSTDMENLKNLSQLVSSSSKVGLAGSQSHVQTQRSSSSFPPKGSLPTITSPSAQTEPVHDGNVGSAILHAPVAPQDAPISYQDESRNLKDNGDAVNPMIKKVATQNTLGSPAVIESQKFIPQTHETLSPAADADENMATVDDHGAMDADSSVIINPVQKTRAQSENYHPQNSQEPNQRFQSRFASAGNESFSNIDSETKQLLVALSQELTSLKSATTQQAKLASDKIKSLEAKNRDLEMEVHQSKIASVPIPQSNTHENVKELNQLLNAKFLDVEELNKIIKDQSAKIETLSSQVENFDDINAQLKELSSKNVLLKEENTQLKEENKKFDEELKLSVNEYSTQIEKLLEKWNNSNPLDGNYEQYEATIKQLRTELGNATSKHSELQGHYEELLGTHEEKSRELTGQMNDFSRLEENYKNALNSVNNSSKALQISQQEMTRLRDKNAQLIRELEELKFSTLDSNNMNRHDDAESSTISNEDLKDAHFNLRIRDLQAELFIIRQERDSLKEEVVQVKKKLMNFDM